MNEQEIRSLFSKLDDQIETLRRKEEYRAKLTQIESWIAELEEKGAQIKALGGTPVVDIEAKTKILRAERDSLQAMLEPASIAAIQTLIPQAPWREPLPEEDVKELMGLRQVIESLDLSHLTSEQRWNQYDSWACQWRIIISRQDRDIVDQSPLLTGIYGAIRDRMKTEKTHHWYIKALDRRETCDWKAKYQQCEAEIRRLDNERVEKEIAHDNIQSEAIWTVMSLVNTPEKTNEEWKRKLKHHVRQAARFKHLREEIAGIVEPLRDVLQSEFDFLWPKDEKEEDLFPIRNMSNREILSRLMRRMKAKTLIGASHGPFEQIYKGFPEQDKGRAKELLEFLCKSDVVRAKHSKIGMRVSIEPKMMPLVDRLIDMENTGNEAIDQLLYLEAQV